ncbi:AAA family ATPase [Paenibacillus radicis (ex Xue et al. 2023)]|uniref:AAA family ATPase n=1 Tax=Paenibacillus radicis (ex Xue et al. 2023) TaxID=2972489 RepID=A0ABT1YJ46_9BACL|nr:AAA family ATPase [Paenibacillus radicis (ex Xue et al. 2023)]MCR8633202.1 AAA family ATPase [Paenibacillus radicis (ex Xue et al. 2023)]
MIHKIERLVSIGKFRNYQSTGDVTFKKFTLVYADNGSGKTTLTSVFRSLAESKPDIVIKRKSTNHMETQVAQIIQRDDSGNNTSHTLRRSGWSNPLPDVEIFDIHFVNENIYSGFDFNDEHKKQLHEFVIGAQGVNIQQQIERNKTEKTALRQRIASLETQIIQLVGNELTPEMLNAFLSLRENEAEDIDVKIAAAIVALNNARASSVIQTLQTLSPINPVDPGLDFEAIISDLQCSMDTIQDEALKSIFNEHCSDLITNTIEDPETWIKKGFNYLKSKTEKIEERERMDLACPMCRQAVVNNSDILRAYTAHFNEEFNSLILRLQDHSRSIPKFNLEATIQSINNTIETNIQRFNLWSSHLSSDVPQINSSIIFNESNLRNELEALISIVDNKCQNPSVAASIEEVVTIKTSLQNINDNISNYNQVKSDFNNSVSNFRMGIQSEQLAQNELNRLKRLEKRFEPSIAAICLTLKTEKQNLRALERNYTQLVLQQNEETTVFFSTYKDRINHYLSEVFRTSFKIESVENVAPQGRATQSKISYKLTMNGYDISFDTSQPNSAKECFSEGDKSTIALAFFLSKVDIDPRLSQKILIFDDPLSSLDRNRRLTTVKLIKDLYLQIKQVIVLSHNEYFLSDLSKGIDRGDKRTLRISENFLTESSRLEPVDLDALVEIDYFRHIKELEKFLENSDINQKDRVLGLMRNILEAHICFKFYRQTTVIPETSRTFGRLIDELVTQNVVFRNDTTPSSIITKLRLINGVSCKPHHGEPEPDYRALGYDPDTMSIRELADLVRDTLDLIDNKL